MQERDQSKQTKKAEKRSKETDQEQKSRASTKRQKRSETIALERNFLSDSILIR